MTDTVKKAIEQLERISNSLASIGETVDYTDIAIQALEQIDKVEESNFSTEQYKADLQGAYDCGYNCGYADAMNDIAESEEEK